MPHDVFLAHAGPDTPLARRLHDALTAPPPLPVYLDARSLADAVQWDLELSRHLDAATLVLALVTPRYEAAHYLRDEVHRSLGHVRAGRQHLLPVYAGGRAITDAPYGLTVVNALSLDALGLQATADRIRDTLAGIRAGQPPPSPAPAPAPAPAPRLAPPWLSPAEVDHLHDVAVNSPALLFDRREVLLRDLPPALRARIPRCHLPGEQLLLDLDTLNRADPLDDGSVPMAAWLRAAVHSTRGVYRRDCAVFERYLAVLAR